jgi:Tol biopolymer transport system component
VEEAEGITFLTMELVKGKTLADLIPQDGMPLERLFDIGILLADAVQAAHERGVIHRDLKPGNVMIDDAGRLKVLDFGLVKLVSAVGDDEKTMTDDEATAQGRVKGTVAYMSPEQAEGKELDARSDIFSLGVVLYQLITGQRPFGGDTPISTMSAILRHDPPSVTKLKPLPRHLGRIIQRCLQKSPDRRFQTARDVCNELEGLKREVESGEVEPVSGVSAVMPADGAASGGRAGTWLWIAAAVLVAVPSIWWALGRKNEPSPAIPPHLEVTKLTSAVGVEHVGSWPPDGSFFAYSHSANGPLDIFIQATAGGDPVRLVESDYDDYPPAWSPNNRWIAFISGRSGTNAIYLVPPLGGTVRHLTDIGYPPLYTADLIALGTTPWSPDGSRLLFARKEGSGAELWIIDVATGEETRLTGGPEANDGGAAWSFDGNSIAFIRITRGLFGIWVIPAQGGEPRPVYEGLEDYWVALGWAPDDRSVVFGSSREGSSTDLWAVDLGSGEIRRLTSGVSEKNGACVGRDGRVLMNDFTHQTDVYLQDIESGEARRLTMHTATNFEAQISPQGDRLAYMSDRSGNSEILILDLKTGREVQVTDHEGVDQSPSWSPDGRTIVFESTRSGERRLWSIDPEGRAARQLLEGQDARLPRFSPDGRAVGFLSSESGTESLWLVEPDGSSPRLVKEDVGDFGWYRDSRRIVYAGASGDFREILKGP